MEINGRIPPDLHSIGMIRATRNLLHPPAFLIATKPVRSSGKDALRMPLPMQSIIIYPILILLEFSELVREHVVKKTTASTTPQSLPL